MVVFPETEKDRVEHFFAEDLPSRVWLDGYFQNRVPGIIYVDNLVAPTISIAVTEFHHITFVGWKGSPRESSKELAAVLSEEIYLSVIWKQELGISHPTENLTGRFGRYEFSNYVRKTDSIPVVPLPEDEFTISEIDRANFNQCQTKGECLYAYETKERFLKECFGIIAKRDETYLGNAEVICQSTDRIGNYRADIQIIVTEKFRRMGIGKRLAGHLIEQMVMRGIHPIWSCNKDNKASEGLARELGFSDPIEFEILSFSIDPGLQKYWVRVLEELDTRFENKDDIVRLLQKKFEFLKK